MRFKGYKLRLKLNILHSMKSAGNAENPHPHTLSITIFFDAKDEALADFNSAQKEIEIYNLLYLGKNFNKTPPFDIIEPTIENIGDEFYNQYHSILLKKNFILRRLEISETPSRIYAVDYKMTDDVLKKSHDAVTLNLLSEKVKNEFANSPQETQGFPHIKEAPQKMLLPKSTEKLGFFDTKNQMVTSISEKQGHHTTLKFIFAALIILAAALVLMVVVKNTGNYPLGLDIYGHLYKSDLLHDSLNSGNPYPLYSPLWYNGMQPYRYWPPISYYIIAFLQNFTAGNVIDAYVIFSGLSFAIGGIGWLLWGIKEKRIMLCTFFSLIWFFLPDNMRVYFSEGNLPRMAVTMLLPLLFYFIWNFVERKEKGKIFPIIFLMALVTLTHVMVAAMVGVATAIFLLVYAIANKSLKMPFACLCGMFFGIALTGIWLVPALTGGIMNTDSSSIMEILYTKASVSLNPFLRLNGNIGSFYYGLAIFVISLIGIILSNKKSLPGFVTTIIIFAGTTVAFAPLVSKLPLSSLLWLRRFTPIAYALFVIAVINWKSCKKAVLIAICGLLVIDCLPSLQLNEYRKSMPKSIGFSTQDSVAERLSLKTAKSITNQRIALMDLSTYGPFPSYFISSESPQTLYTFGWAWQGATTGNNIVMLNEALETGRFNYLFDRCIELGNDTVVLSKEILSNVKNYDEKLFKAAELSGYTLAENGEFSLVFHKNTPKTFGTINEYQSLAIGSSANEITLLYPSFKQGNSYNIEDYSFEELLKYQVIYLSNFQYYDKINAENIVTKLSENGVKIVIDMNRLPTNALTTRAEFLGVSGQTIVLNNNYPDIIFGNKVVKSAPFKEGLEQWNTVYIDGADETAGYSWINGRKVPVLGTKFNENLTFMGFNLLYHSMETGDENVLELMNEIFETDTEKLPKREIVPLDISFENEKITVNSAFDNVNTTLSFEDNFYSSEKISDQNNLLTVEKGTTTIYFKYPELGKGLAVMAFGTVGSVLLAIILFKKSRKKKVHKIV